MLKLWTMEFTNPGMKKAPVILSLSKDGSVLFLLLRENQMNIGCVIKLPDGAAGRR
jgi:hypothetical protein